MLMCLMPHLARLPLLSALETSYFRAANQPCTLSRGFRKRSSWFQGIRSMAPALNGNSAMRTPGSVRRWKASAPRFII